MKLRDQKALAPRIAKAVLTSMTVVIVMALPYEGRGTPLPADRVAT